MEVHLGQMELTIDRMYFTPQVMFSKAWFQSMTSCINLILVQYETLLYLSSEKKIASENSNGNVWKSLEIKESHFTYNFNSSLTSSIFMHEV